MNRQEIARSHAAPCPDPHADAARIERALAGDDGAFEELARTHYEAVWRVVWRVLRDDREAEDVLVEVFVAARRELSGVERAADFAAWLRRNAVREAQARASMRRGPGTRTRRSRAEGESALLDGCVEALNAPLRAALSLQLEGFRYDEIAEGMGLPAGTVRARVLLAREAVHKCARRKREVR
jgi:RNA polymerase sigma-70 factor (ECF subfamily)